MKTFQIFNGVENKSFLNEIVEVDALSSVDAALH